MCNFNGNILKNQFFNETKQRQRLSIARKKTLFYSNCVLTIPVRLPLVTRMKMKHFTKCPRRGGYFLGGWRAILERWAEKEGRMKTNGRILEGYRSNAILSTQIPQETPLGQLRTVLQELL